MELAPRTREAEGGIAAAYAEGLRRAFTCAAAAYNLAQLPKLL